MPNGGILIERMQMRHLPLALLFFLSGCVADDDLLLHHLSEENKRLRSEANEGPAPSPPEEQIVAAIDRQTEVLQTGIDKAVEGGLKAWQWITGGGLITLVAAGGAYRFGRRRDVGES